MTINKAKKYTAKLLLFGEHTILKGSQALAMPLPLFYGQWAYSTDTRLQLNLADFAEYLDKNMPGVFNISFFKNELSKNLFFQSNIPSGYGIGSSGALVAAVFDSFCWQKERVAAADLQGFLGRMESFFHGASSGIDPLICYLERPILLEKSRENREVNLPDFSAKKDWTLFLLNTQIPRKTGSFVQIFLENCQQASYEEAIQTDFKPLVQRAINHFLEGEWALLYKDMAAISFLQKQYFLPMIPPGLQSVWDVGLDSDLFTLKLCGAGGGGFLLGMTHDFRQTQQSLKDWQLIPLFEHLQPAI